MSAGNCQRQRASDGKHNATHTQSIIAFNNSIINNLGSFNNTDNHSGIMQAIATDIVMYGCRWQLCCVYII